MIKLQIFFFFSEIVSNENLGEFSGEKKNENVENPKNDFVSALLLTRELSQIHPKREKFENSRAADDNRLRKLAPSGISLKNMESWDTLSIKNRFINLLYEVRLNRNLTKRFVPTMKIIIQYNSNGIKILNINTILNYNIVNC